MAEAEHGALKFAQIAHYSWPPSSSTVRRRLELLDPQHRILTHSLSRLQRSRLRAFPSSSCRVPSAASLPVSEGYLDTSLWRCTDGKGS